MGILTKEVEVKPTGKMIQYYKDKGYDAKYNQPLVVRIEDLPNNSHARLEILCDMCNHNTMLVEYCDYNRIVKNTGSYVCRDCSYEKMKQTNLLRYKTDNYAKTQECREKIKNSLMAKHGVEHNSQLPDYKEKYQNTCVERYGELYKSQFAEKAFKTFYDNAGYNNPAQSPKVREKMAKSCIEHYGVSNPAQSSEVREKMSQTLYANSSQKVSRQQRYINNVYQGILNFPVKYYNVDIYLPDDNLTIEYDGGFHLGNVITGRETMEEHTQKEIIRNNIVKREGYKQMRIISSNDKLPSDSILLQMLQDARNYFSEYPNHSWIEFNLDASLIRNAENKQGIPYDFGTLRIIKDNDIPDIEQQTTKKGA